MLYMAKLIKIDILVRDAMNFFMTQKLLIASYFFSLKVHTYYFSDFSKRKYLNIAYNLTLDHFLEISYN